MAKKNMALRDESWVLRKCKEQVEGTWGEEARHLVGDNFYQALLYERLVHLCAMQDDEMVSAQRVREILAAGRDQIIDEMNEEAAW